MGHWKDQIIQQHEQGWDFTDQSVCSGCVDEDALEAILRQNEDAATHCDFCYGFPAAPLDVLLKAFVGGLRNEYENALDGVGWDGREGGYQWNPQWDTWDLISEYEEVFSNDRLIDAVRKAVHDITWVEFDFATRRRDVVLMETWERFCEAVKHETRFVLWLLPQNEDLGAGEISPSEILDHIEPLVEHLDLVRYLPAGRRFWRAQTHSEPIIDHSASRLGTVPRELALQPHRMSPAGIPMFYGADDMVTAIEEVVHSLEDTDEDMYVTCGQFELTADLPVVSLTGLPAEPSMFDPELGAMRRQIRFLRMFVRQLSSRVQPLYEQIDYVPTQIVCEYLLHVHGGGNRARGLVYYSSLSEGACVALDILNEQCIDCAADTSESDVNLRLVADSVRCFPVADVAGCSRKNPRS